MPSPGFAFALLWSSPNSMLGLVLAALALAPRGSARIHTGVLEVEGPSIAWLLSRLPPRPHGVSAMTLGHVVVARDPSSLDRTRAHERVHVRQAARWGPFFIPAYAAASIVAWVRGGDAYRDNRFEREAYAKADVRSPAR